MPALPAAKLPADTRSAPPMGYSVWRDRKGWRFTTENGDFDSRPFKTREGANHGAWLHDAQQAMDGWLNQLHREGNAV